MYVLNIYTYMNERNYIFTFSNFHSINTPQYIILNVKKYIVVFVNILVEMFNV